MKASLMTLCVGVLCCLVIYKIFRRIAGDNDAVSDAETTDYTVTVSVAKRLQELYGGAAYVGLRIPNPETRSLQNIDIVLVKNGWKKLKNKLQFWDHILNKGEFLQEKDVYLAK